MLSLNDPRTTNPVLASLQIETSDKIISIKEDGNTDSNFIITHLIKQIFHGKHRLCLVSLHNNLDHYQHVGKKLSYDLNNAIQKGDAKVIDPLSDLVENIGQDDDPFWSQLSDETTVKTLFLKINQNIQELLKGLSNDSQVYLIIDDLSHLLDLGVELNHVISFINYCFGLVSCEKVCIIINTHVCNKMDEIISNTIQYVCDVHINVSPLKTGRSTDVTGSIIIERSRGSKSHYQYKAFDRGIKTFHPGESIFNLLK